MSVEDTNTPNGASRDLYSKNEDIGKQELTVTDMSQKDPEKDLTGYVYGDNTVSDEYVSIDNTIGVRDFGSVRIGATLVGQPVKAGLEAKSTIKLSMEEVKKAIKARGAITAEAYIEAKKADLEKRSLTDKEKSEDFEQE